MENRTVDRSIRIKDILNTVQSELVEAQAERIRSGQAPLFHVRRMHLEVKVTATEESSGQGKLDLKVISADQATKISDNMTHRIFLELEIPTEEQQVNAIQFKKKLFDEQTCPYCNNNLQYSKDKNSVECEKCGFAFRGCGV